MKVSRNEDGSSDVTVSEGKIGAFRPRCSPIWFAPGEYDTGCELDSNAAG